MTKQWPYLKLAAECVIATEQMVCIMQGKGYCLSARGTTGLFSAVQCVLCSISPFLCSCILHALMIRLSKKELITA